MLWSVGAWCCGVDVPSPSNPLSVSCQRCITLKVAWRRWKKLVRYEVFWNVRNEESGHLIQDKVSLQFFSDGYGYDVRRPICKQAGRTAHCCPVSPGWPGSESLCHGSSMQFEYPIGQHLAHLRRSPFDPQKSTSKLGSLAAALVQSSLLPGKK